MQRGESIVVACICGQEKVTPVAYTIHSTTRYRR